MMLKRLYCAVAAFAFVAGAHANPLDHGDLVTFPTRAGVTQSIFVESPTPNPPWVVVLFPGGEGQLKLTDRGATDGGNFLIRSASHWVDWGNAAALVDTPSDQPGGIYFATRMTKDSFADTQAIVAALRKRFPGAKIALIGTSAGTLSVGNALQRDPTLADAFVLTSSVTVAAKNNSATLGNLDVSGTKTRVLMVSNEGDACPLTPAYASERLAKNNHYDFIRVESTQAKGDACGPRSPHGYLGIEVPVLKGILDWLNGKPAADQ